MTEPNVVPFPSAGPISIGRMDALRADMLASPDCDASVVQREADRISDHAREYVSSGDWAPVSDSVIRADLKRVATLMRSLSTFRISTTAEVNISWDFLAEPEDGERDIRVHARAYDALRKLMFEHGDAWAPLAEHFDSMAEAIQSRTAPKPNLLVRLLWVECMQAWNRATNAWPVTTRDEGGMPLAPLFKHVTAMVWELAPAPEQEPVRAAANSAKAFRHVLDCLRSGSDPLSR